MKNNKILSLSALLPLLISSVAMGCSDDDPTAPPASGVEEQIQQMLDEAVAGDLPGVVVQIQGPDHEITASAGLSNVDANRAYDPTQPFHIASTGKMFIGAALARLDAQGVLDLDDTIATWLPSEVGTRIPSSDVITVRDLLQQTSGIVDVLNEMDTVADAIAIDPERVWTDAELVTYAFDQPLHFTPRSQYSYSNTNFMLASLILQQATGKTHAAALRELLFDPLGMSATVTSNHEALVGDAVHGYLMVGGEAIDATVAARHWEAGSGGQWSTVSDLTRYLHGFFGSDLLVDDAVRAEVVGTSGLFPYGLGIFVVDSPAGPMVGHGGLFLGYSTTTGYFADAETSIVLCANAQNGSGSAEALFARIRDLLLAD